jgi:hypothetical protein
LLFLLGLLSFWISLLSLPFRLGFFSGGSLLRRQQ